ncbi:Multidrug efflux pump subunit AcrA (membrane-fusion protein) [Aquiflexum balticum DSM 16537]|uniref:Multidrug efflux pump subunit AcrA (Membrane-fusion protein) n=1 Tax=Aquiflexum balticum DSM 16537 TaxID=758820 RepID=A0A1W2H3Q0_9BACT|nr:efflux RND transporter periplasmic adaptor subunit [Aquiflexum balticum]SMD43258.1 Multidrug efflux pump subunit AcrA (membrane-fusion protein) [Aquiflexum balticum DSM 16537]
MQKKPIYIGIAIVLSLLAIFYFFSRGGVEEGFEIMAKVNQGDFRVEITTSGELQALNSVEILGPSEARRYRVGNITIESMVDEGTIVKQGDFIASLDRTELFGRLEDRRIDLEQNKALYEQTQLDTSLVLRQERDNLINMEYEVGAMKLILDQSQYEPPAIIKQNEYNYEKAKRDLEQAKERYRIKTLQEKARMVEVSARLREVQLEVSQIEEVLKKFTVTAPQNGMVIYYQGRGGKIKEGSQISSWNPVVATLPDLSSMQSVTYVNEVDIRKVKSGQKVELGLDAFPERNYTGEVLKVANVGQQRPNSDAKVFEVIIKVNESDASMRPSMTTSNTIIIEKLENVLYVPLEAINVMNDSVNYVFLENKKKQEVKLGLANANDIVIEMGLSEGQEVYLSTPAWSENTSITLLEELNGKRNPELDFSVPITDSEIQTMNTSKNGRIRNQ